MATAGQPSLCAALRAKAGGGGNRSKPGARTAYVMFRTLPDTFGQNLLTISGMQPTSLSHSGQPRTEPNALRTRRCPNGARMEIVVMDTDATIQFSAMLAWLRGVTLKKPSRTGFVTLAK